jgi:hypothetical protein
MIFFSGSVCLYPRFAALFINITDNVAHYHQCCCRYLGSGCDTSTSGKLRATGRSIRSDAQRDTKPGSRLSLYTVLSPHYLLLNMHRSSFNKYRIVKMTLDAPPPRPLLHHTKISTRMGNSHICQCLLLRLAPRPEHGTYICIAHDRLAQMLHAMIHVQHPRRSSLTRALCEFY